MVSQLSLQIININHIAIVRMQLQCYYTSGKERIKCGDHFENSVERQLWCFFFFTPRQIGAVRSRETEKKMFAV
uniref:Uncharacterized protein n=1 Tax=Arundo donax TaxID=35708 RepID=A0A0A9DGZ7_ARUDO